MGSFDENFSVWCTPACLFWFLFCILGVISKKTSSNPVSWNVTLMLSSRIFMVWGLNIWVAYLFWINFWGRLQLYYFACEHFVFPTLLVKYPLLFCSMSGLSTLSKNYLIICLRVYLWLYPVLLVPMSVFMSIPHCRFVIHFKFRNYYVFQLRYFF